MDFEINDLLKEIDPIRVGQSTVTGEQATDIQLEKVNAENKVQLLTSKIIERHKEI